MLTLALSAKGRSLAGGNSYEGPAFDIAHAFSGVPSSGNFKFIRFRLSDEDCTLEWASGALTITPSVSTLPTHAQSPTCTTLYGYIISRPGDAGAAGTLSDAWANGGPAGDMVVPAAGFLHMSWDAAGKVFPTDAMEINTGNDGVIDVLLIVK